MKGFAGPSRAGMRATASRDGFTAFQQSLSSPALTVELANTPAARIAQTAATLYALSPVTSVTFVTFVTSHP